MRRLFTIFVLILLPLQLLAMDKYQFDIQESGLKKAAQTAYLASYSSEMLQNDITEISMVTGGYFTIGTTEGSSQSLWDNACDVTFGHPYALTSYPIIKFNGQWQKLDDFAASRFSLIPAKIGDTLRIQASETEFMQLSFSMTPADSGTSVEILYHIKNISPESCPVSLGLVLDPALGKWGDGSLQLSENVLRDTLLINTDIPSHVNIWEREHGARGMGLDIQFVEENPEFFRAANWFDIYENPDPQQSVSELRDLYDLALNMTWQESELAPGQEKVVKLKLFLPEPDFSSQVFMRWDLPHFLALQNNTLFPRQWDSCIQMNTLDPQSVNNATLMTDSSTALTMSPEEKNISFFSENILYEKIRLQSKEVYEDQTARVGLKILNNEDIIDEIWRTVFIPAVPLSDTGLVIEIDSLDITNYPEIKFTFEPKIEATEQYLLNLHKENIFLYENEKRIKEFTVTKDTTGGIGAADIIFVLDVTGSMGDEINAVKEHIIEFADSLSYRGIDYQLGMVTFLDKIENVYPFTNDVQEFQRIASLQWAHGGGDRAENSLDALMTASNYPFRPNANRIAIWITDADYHENNAITSLNKQRVINSLLTHEITVHAIGREQFKSYFYDPIITSTGGEYYNIDGNFRDILMNISHLKTAGKYLLSFRSVNTDQETNNICLEIHYAGLGGKAIIDYSPSTTSSLNKRMVCYPNPFNPATTIFIKNVTGLSGEVNIFNIIGQRVKHFSIRNSSQKNIIWNARDDMGLPVGTGFYIVHLALFDQKGQAFREVEKILYIK